MRTGFAFFAFAVAAVAQTPASQKPTVVMAAGAIGGVVGAVPGGFSLQPVVGHPYSAEQVTDRVQTLADGTCSTQATQTTKLYRDSAGRTRTEHTFRLPPGMVMATAGPSFIEIADPVAGYRYMLDPRNQTARRTAWPPAMHRANATSPPNQPRPAVLPATTAAFNADSTRLHPDMSHESLGTQTIEGVLAEGTRMITTFPVGFMGNDRPITTVSETWTSPDIKTIVLSKMSDPRSGETTTKLTNIVTADPDPALFQVPAEYSIVDEQTVQ